MRWNLKPTPDSEKIKSLQDSLNIDELIATLLLQRGIETFEQARQFFRPQLEDLHDPYLMKDMDKAVVRIEKAINEQENILVFGDYDVDGTTAVSLVSSYLKSFYPNVDTYIPDRYDEGYGVSFKGIDYADDRGLGKRRLLMKELIRQYAGTAIAVVTALVLIALVSEMSVVVEKGIPKSRALCETDTAAFEGYWRSR